MLVYVIIAILAYAIGSINFSVIISRKMAGFDVREKGSGNAGSTNVLRTVGKKAALITLVCDILKGVVAILLALLVSVFAKEASAAILVEAAALAVVIGHTYPIFFEFRGGKGVATSLGIILVINWQIGLICLIFALSIMAIARMVSLGSISAAVLFAILTIFTRDHYIGGIEFDFSFVIFGILLAAIVIFNHRSNLKRIIAGTENKLSFKKKEEKTEKEEVEAEDVKQEVVEENKESEEVKEESNNESEEAKEE